jgi:hypothetical protein
MAALSMFVSRIRQPGSAHIAPDRFADVLGVPLKHLAEFAGVHRNTLQRNPAQPMVQRRLRDAARVIESAIALADGDEEKALYWFRNQPIADYRFRTAEQMVADGNADAVMSWLEDQRNGPLG